MGKRPIGDERSLEDEKDRRKAPLTTRNDIGEETVKNITGALNALLADVYALYFKTKNFHWHISGPHFRDYHLLLDEQADQIFANRRRHSGARSQDWWHHHSVSRPHHGCNVRLTTKRLR